MCFSHDHEQENGVWARTIDIWPRGTMLTHTHNEHCICKQLLQHKWGPRARPWSCKQMELPQLNNSWHLWPSATTWGFHQINPDPQINRKGSPKWFWKKPTGSWNGNWKSSNLSSWPIPGLCRSNQTSDSISRVNISIWSSRRSNYCKISYEIQTTQALEWPSHSSLPPPIQLAMNLAQEKGASSCWQYCY